MVNRIIGGALGLVSGLIIDAVFFDLFDKLGMDYMFFAMPFLLTLIGAFPDVATEIFNAIPKISKRK